ncbi:MAG TPA: hypothetical protein PK919_08035 [Candidatus Aminicenantes bacterium]|nr:hypothetical protein [Candidatus Aminicenantes bacterium]
MKKLAALILVALSGSAVLPAAGGRAILNLYGTGLKVAQNKFTEQERRDKAYFEVKAAFALSGNLYLWASHGYFPMRDSWKDWDQKGSFDPDLDVNRKLGKRIIAGGCGVYMGYFEPGQFAVRAEAGVCHVANDITTVSNYVADGGMLRTLEDRQRAIGGRASLAFTYGFYRSVFAELALGYTLAPDKTGGKRSNLGGVHLALGLGMQL